MRRAQILLLFLCGTAMVTLAVAADSDPGRTRLEEIKERDPERYARIQKNFERFSAMPPDQQDRLRRLDQQLHEEDSQTRVRLMRVLDDYAAWYTRLPGEDRQRLQSAADANEKLKIVREIRGKQWFAQLPQGVRDEWKSAPPDKRSEILDKWRKEEQKLKEDWTVARRAWDEFGGESPKIPLMGKMSEINTFVDRLTPMLNASEKARLAMASGRTGNPFFFSQVIVDQAELHPILGLEPKYKDFKSLPEEYQTALKALGSHPKLSKAEGSWPAFPIEVTEWVRENKKTMKVQLGPSTATDFPKATIDGIRSLQTKLSAADLQRLKKAEGLWPEYPRALHELALKYKVAIPELTLPGDPQHWNRMKMLRPGIGYLPEPPEHQFREFAYKLAMQDSTAPRLSNPADREELKRRFFDQNPDILEKLRQQDKMKWEKKGKKFGGEH